MSETSKIVITVIAVLTAFACGWSMGNCGIPTFSQTEYRASANSHLTYHGQILQDLLVNKKPVPVYVFKDAFCKGSESFNNLEIDDAKVGFAAKDLDVPSWELSGLLEKKNLALVYDGPENGRFKLVCSAVAVTPAPIKP